jgi:hypothetical protein
MRSASITTLLLLTYIRLPSAFDAIVMPAIAMGREIHLPRQQMCIMKSTFSAALAASAAYLLCCCLPSVDHQ